MNKIPGYRVLSVLGAIYALTVRSRNWSADIGGILKSIVGGEIKYFSNMRYSVRNEAVERLLGEWMQRGGNTVVGMRFNIKFAAWSQICA
jgi:uncharacterized protein YbjQ (UPF0145 family)